MTTDSHLSSPAFVDVHASDDYGEQPPPSTGTTTTTTAPAPIHGAMPTTGSNPWPVVLLALALLVAGAVVLIVRAAGRQS